MPRGGYDRELAARVLVDALTMGDRTAADRNEVSVKTVQRYRARMRDDLVLAELVQKKGRTAEHGWHFARARFLRRTLEKLDKMVQKAKPEDMPNVIEALRAAGDLDLASEALGVGSRVGEQGPSPAEDAGAEGAEESS
jgi:hypothetical protein